MPGPCAAWLRSRHCRSPVVFGGGTTIGRGRWTRPIATTSSRLTHIRVARRVMRRSVDANSAVAAQPRCARNLAQTRSVARATFAQSVVGCPAAFQRRSGSLSRWRGVFVALCRHAQRRATRRGTLTPISLLGDGGRADKTSAPRPRSVACRAAAGCAWIAPLVRAQRCAKLQRVACATSGATPSVCGRLAAVVTHFASDQPVVRTCR